MMRKTYGVFNHHNLENMKIVVTFRELIQLINEH
jgi:hypothetical protein